MVLHRFARTEWLATAAAALALLVDVLYLLIIHSQGDEDFRTARVGFVAGCIAAAALVLVLGSITTPKVQAGLFAAATALLAAWALVGIFSIGLLLVPAAVMAGLAAGGVATRRRSETAIGAFGALVLVVAGLALT
jgi:hypothetical protein